MNGMNLPYKILIVDDDESHRTLIKTIFQDPEFEVMEAQCGEEALTYIKEHDFDVVLVDKRMPGISGDEVCYRIRHDLDMSLLPLFMVTGATADEELEKSLQAGANDFIRKPYESFELIARVRAAANHKRSTDQLDSMESMLFAVARMVEVKDEGTGDHCSRLEHMAVVFGKELGLNKQELLTLRYAGVLHDIGKLSIPDSILLKRGGLTDDEWHIMQQHSAIGSQLCKSIKSLKHTVPIIRHHHERWDGGGYPDGLKGEDIPYLARVFSIVDIYDALASERPYKKAFGVEKIVRIFEEERANGWRDPELVTTFLTLLRNRPKALLLPTQIEKDLGSQIFDDVMATGVFEWDREEHRKESLQ